MRNKLKSQSSKVKIVNIYHLQQGFTLIEMLVYIALLSIFLIVLTDIFIGTINVQFEAESSSYIEQDGRFILARLSYDISRANAITIPESLNSPNNTITIQIGTDSYTYSLVGDNLVLSSPTATAPLNSSFTRISSPTFIKIGEAGKNETVKIQFTITSTIQQTSGEESKVFETTVGRR